MDNVLAWIACVSLVFGAVTLLDSVALKSTDSKIIRQCKEVGHYNFGQQRILCSVEEKSK